MSTIQREISQYLEVEHHAHAIVVRFRKDTANKILDEDQIKVLGIELHAFAHATNQHLILDFTNVEFLSSAALGKLITMDKIVKQFYGRSVILCSMLPEIYEVFCISRLNKLFEWSDDLEEALAKAPRTMLKALEKIRLFAPAALKSGFIFTHKKTAC